MNGSNSTRYNPDFENQYIWTRRMALLLRIYTPGVVILGIALNLYVLFLVSRFYRRLNFVPQLLAIILSSLGFLCVLAAYVAGREFLIAFSRPFCQMSIYIMASTQHLPGMCLSAISVERYLTIFHSTMASTGTHHGRCGNATIVLLIGLVSFGFQIYTIIISDTDPRNFACKVVPGSISRETTNMLLSFATLFLYFIPSFIATSVNMALVARLYWLFRPQNLGFCLTSGQYERKKSSFMNAYLGPVDIPTTPAIQLDDSRHLPAELRHRINRGKRRTLLSFATMMMLDLSLHFPSCFLNITVRYFPSMTPSGLGLTFLATISHILWHLQFVVNPLAVLVPVFHKRSSRFPPWRVFFKPFSIEGRSVLRRNRRRNIRYVVQVPDDVSMMIPPVPVGVYGDKRKVGVLPRQDETSNFSAEK